MVRRSLEHFLAIVNELYKKNQISIEDLRSTIVLKNSNNVDTKIYNIIDTILKLINEETIIYKSNTIREEKYLLHFMNEKSRKIREMKIENEKGEKIL